MTIQLPNIEHRVYRHTFLDQVTLQIHFDADVVNRYDILEKFFAETYNLQLDEEKFNMLKYKSIHITGNENDLSIKFASNFVQIKINQQLYMSFDDSMLPLLKPIVVMLAGLDAKINKIALHKINSWEFERKPEIPVRTLMCEVFSQNLTAMVSEGLDGPEYIKTIVLDKIESPSALVLAFGYITAPDDNCKGRIILDTEAIQIDKNTISCETLTQSAKQLNNELYSLFHWSVTDTVIEKMK